MEPVPFSLMGVLFEAFLSMALLLVFNGVVLPDCIIGDGEAILVCVSEIFLLSSFSFRLELDFLVFKVKEALGISFFV